MSKIVLFNTYIIWRRWLAPGGCSWSPWEAAAECSGTRRGVGAGFSLDQKQGLLSPSCRSFSESRVVEAANHRAELPLGFWLVSAANPYSGLVRAPTLPIQSFRVSPPVSCLRCSVEVCWLLNNSRQRFRSWERLKDLMADVCARTWEGPPFAAGR